MAAHMKLTVMPPAQLMGALLAAAVIPAASADPLPDPTRPPLGLTAPAGESGHAAGQAAPPATSRGLQFIIIAPDRRAAIINGRKVALGGKYGDATLVEINEGSVVLQDTQGKRISFNMFPGVEIKAGTPSPRPQPGKAENGLVDKPPVEESSPQAAPQEEK